MEEGAAENHASQSHTWADGDLELCFEQSRLMSASPRPLLSRGFICSRDVSVAVGVQTVMDLVLKVSIVTAGSAAHPPPRSAHGCASAAPHLRLPRGA